MYITNCSGLKIYLRYIDCSKISIIIFFLNILIPTSYFQLIWGKYDFEFVTLDLKFKVSDPKKLRIPSFRQASKNVTSLAAILDPPFWICKFWHQFWNKPPQEPHYTKFYTNATKNQIFSTFIWFWPTVHRRNENRNETGCSSLIGLNLIEACRDTCIDSNA